MSKAILAYSFDGSNSSLIKLKDIASYDAGSTAWSWSLLYLGAEKATKNTADWDLDFSSVGGLITGPYIINLSVTVAGETDIVTLGVSYDATLGTVKVYQPIYDQVTTIMGPNFQIDSQEYLNLRDKWQSLLWLSAGVSEEDIHNETVWPAMFNTLIAYLITRGLILSGANRDLASISSSGAIKKVETGPVNSEWFSIGSVYKDIFVPGGLWDQLSAAICDLAGTLAVIMTGCPDTVGGHPPIILPKSGDYSYEHQYIVAPQFQPKPS